MSGKQSSRVPATDEPPVGSPRRRSGSAPVQQIGGREYEVHRPADIQALQNLAGNRAVARQLGLDDAPPTVLHTTPPQVSRLATTAASLGETGAVGQVKALVGQSNYVKIKEELAKYHMAAQPQVRRQHLNRMLDLIAKWMKANAKSTTSGNLTRMQRLQVLRSEIQQELAQPALTGVGKQAAAPGAALEVAAATLREPVLPGIAPPAVGRGAPYQPPVAAPAVGRGAPYQPVAEPAVGRGGPYQPPVTEPAVGRGGPYQPVAEPAVGRGGPYQPPVAEPATEPAAPLEVEAATTDDSAVPAEVEPLLPPQADETTKKLSQLKDQIDGTARIASKVALIKVVQQELEQLLPTLADPALVTVRRAVSDYAQTLLQALPALEEQAEYMAELESQKFAFLSAQGVVAIQSAIELAQGNHDGSAGMSENAANLTKDSRITDAELAAIKIYTAPDYRYINAGLAQNRAGWLQSALDEHVKKASPRAKDTRILGAALAPGHLGPLSPGDSAAAEGVRHGKFAVEGLKKLPPWKGETYRGMGLSPEEFKTQFEDTNVWKAASFTSTSVKKDISEAFAQQETKPGRIGFLLRFDVNNGRDINLLSIFGNEGEILLMPGASADILRIETDPGPPAIKVIYLKQIS